MAWLPKHVLWLPYQYLKYQLMSIENNSLEVQKPSAGFVFLTPRS